MQRPLPRQGAAPHREMAELDLQDTIAAAIAATTPAFTRRGAHIRSEVPREELRVRGDRQRLAQLLTSLLSNAALDASLGSVTVLRADRDDLFVTLRLREDPANAHTPASYGIPFLRAIVDQHDGTIDMDRGDLVVSLPLVTTRDTNPIRRRRILVVDDQDDPREMLRLLFEARGHDVREAADGRTALAAIIEHVPDVAFVDVELPVMSGLDVARRVRARPELGRVKLVALTGHADRSTIAATRAAGFDDHVAKPASLARLEELVAPHRMETIDDD